MDAMHVFHEPIATYYLYIDAAIGAAILWAKLGKTNRRVYGLSDVVEMLISENWPRVRMISEFVIFLLIGTYVSVALFDPSTGGQALAAGLGWTGLASK